ncbi:Liver carboxylesterase 4 [Wickerhamomyces ciferrii]|uniref:Carboxylic ester hydrolase n=1 Tax=Wickerhamomyces ciferrii (strain ATCC 14091 / BCRC 22168 / CBS 111 / JCM 3599 / NBRC 0793 / NRRL Y-1031 F-60-10) TaxID=1206466 RepID=K0KN23_WICCF|nr:Liver carboxylesterase 4 [Wickerhamomyces ciferrii]CCH42754.1 Liver carboxylesterase 4 [Wickerhamomyces ciferrii]
MNWYLLYPCIILYLSILSNASSIIQKVHTPIVKLQNGTISGNHLPRFNQDVFLGIPFAEPPINELRFQPPQSYNTTWSGIKSFTEYGDACYSATKSVSNATQSEDCLTLNVVKPHGYYGEKLPVVIWIHGGSFDHLSSSYSLFNGSFIVQQSEILRKPILFVSFNYRLNGFGFLNSNEIVEKGWTNIGLRDQIKAVEWVHENIESFGGDPNHLVLWGESAGGKSVGRLLNNNKYLGPYIKGGILESGANVFVNVQKGVTTSNQESFDNVVRYFNCESNYNNTDALSCLQKVDADDLRKAFNISNGIISREFKFPSIDNDVVPDSGYNTVKAGNTTWNVPLLIGTNSDEGSYFTNVSIGSVQESKDYLRTLYPNLKSNSIDKLIALYPNKPGTITPTDPNYAKGPIKYPDSIGDQYKTLTTLNSDVLYIAATKITAQAYVNLNQPVYKYRFNIPNLETNGEDYYKGSTHGQEVQYVFNNNESLKKSNEVNNKVYGISDTLSKLWIFFINDLNPNPRSHSERRGFEVEVPEWPLYNDGEQQVVFDLKGFYVERDIHRIEQFEFIESIIHELDG